MELWFCKNVAITENLQEIFSDIIRTRPYSNMAIVQRLCPDIGLTPIPTHTLDDIQPITDWDSAERQTQPTLWVYERGLGLMQDRAIRTMTDIPLRITPMQRDDRFLDLPVGWCEVYYLHFPPQKNASGVTEPLPTRQSPNGIAAYKHVVFPCHEKSKCFLQDIHVPDRIDYQKRKKGESAYAPDGEDEIPKQKNSTETMQDQAEDGGGREFRKELTREFPYTVDMSTSLFKVDPDSGKYVLESEAHGDRPLHKCCLCPHTEPESRPIDFRRLGTMGTHALLKHSLVIFQIVLMLASFSRSERSFVARSVPRQPATCTHSCLYFTLATSSFASFVCFLFFSFFSSQMHEY